MTTAAATGNSGGWGGATAATTWTAVAAGADVTTTPQALRAGGRDWTAVRLEPGGPVRLLTTHCPHRLVPLVAGQVDGGRLRCLYHGWEFDGEGTCVLVPSLGETAAVPPRASLPAPPPTRERNGVVEALLPIATHPNANHPVATDPDATDPVATDPDATDPDATDPGHRDGLGNEDPRLARAWHPVALSAELTGGPLDVLLLGRRYRLDRTAGPGRTTAEPAPYAVTERWGLVWLAPEEPAVPLFDEPDAEDAEYVGAWLPPVRTPAPAGFVADNFLDVAHFPFVHAGTFGAAEARVVEPYDVQPEPGGLRSVQVQDFDNPNDPGVLAGVRPLRQRRRATYVYRAPFQLLLRLEELDAGAVKTILFFAQPESTRSTRIYTKMLLHGIGGQQRPDAPTVAGEVAFEEAVLAEDLALQERLTETVLPLDLRAEMHVRADRLGVALRRTLRELVGAAGAPGSGP